MDRELSFHDVLVQLINDLFRMDVVEIAEPCAHEVQYGGMCAECGKDMTECVYPLLFTEKKRR